MLESLTAAVKSGSKSLDSLEDLFVMELKELYDVENQLVDALPKMEDSASTPELKKSFHEHLGRTQEQRRRLEEIFRQMNMEPSAEKCEGMRGLLTEGEILLKAKGDPKVKDAAIIAAAQRVEHYEMAAYGAVRTYADQLGRKDIASILQQTLDEEGEADKTLTQVALGRVDRDAAGEA